MKLVPLALEHIQGHPSLPFHLYGSDGRLLLPANARLDNPRVLERLRQQRSVYVQPNDYESWRLGMAKAVDTAFFNNVSLSQLAKARPDPVVRTGAPEQPGDLWENLVKTLNAGMQALGTDKPWMERVDEVHEKARSLAERRKDEAVFHFVYTGGIITAFYSARQALRTMIIASDLGRELKWDEERIVLLEKAALTMNVAMWRQQDQMVTVSNPNITPETQALLQAHGAESARLLQEGGVTDELWLEAVRLHDDAELARQPIAQLSPAQQMAQVLNRVERYGALISRRAGREALSPTQAAQQVCLGADGRPDTVGALLLKVMGLYPPGSYVALASSEVGIVLARGDHVRQPVVAALRNAQGMSMAEPRLRFTGQPQVAVRSALRPKEVTVDPPMAKLQELRSFLRSAQAVNTPAPAPAAAAAGD